MKKHFKLSLSLAAALSMFVSVAGTTFAQSAPSYNQGLATWKYQENVRCYRIYYKETGAKDWQHSVHCKDLRNPVWQYTIKYLKPNTSYTYNVQVVGYDRNTWWLGEKTLVTSPQQ